MIKISPKYVLFLLCIIAGSIYAIISLGGHYFYNSNAWDLGIFNQTIFQYAHGTIGPNTLRNVDTLFADHVEVFLILLSPLWYIFGSYTLLVAQIASILIGGIGIYKFGEIYLKNTYWTLVPIVIFFGFFGIIQAFAFDYHNNVLAIGLIPWIYYTFVKKKYLIFWILSLGFLLAKENMGVIGLGIGISLLFFSENKTQKIHAILMSVLSVLVFVFLIKYLIPLINDGHYSHWGYTAIGNTFGESIRNILQNPLIPFPALINTPEKIETIKILLLSGIWICLFIPRFWILGILLLSQKLLSSSVGISGFQFHYSAEIAILLSLCIILFIVNYRNKYKKAVLLISIYLIVSNIALTMTLPVYTGKNINEYARSNVNLGYKQSIDTILQAVRHWTGSISASNTIVPHIANRNNIFLFPEIQESEYVIVDTVNPNMYPFNSRDVILETMDTLSGYTLENEQNGIYLYRKE